MVNQTYWAVTADNSYVFIYIIETCPKKEHVQLINTFPTKSLDIKDIISTDSVYCCCNYEQQTWKKD